MVNFKNNKGITLYALIITVVVLVLIAGTATYTGMDVYQDTKEEAFIQELQIVQNAVNNEHSKIELASLNDENQDGAFDYIYNMTWQKGSNIKDIYDDLPTTVRNLIGEGNGYRYFEKEDLLNLGIQGVNQPLLINFTTRDVISVNGYDGKYTLPEFNGTTNYNSNVILTIDDVPIPDGFVYLTGSKDEGLVIKNIKDGNEFVWVPVENFSDFAVLQDGSSTNYRGQLWATSLGNNFGTKNETYNANSELREPANLNDSYDNATNLSEWTSDLFQNEYNKMAESVKKYAGFYVGRYETNSSYGSTKEEIPVLTETWYELYTGQKRLYDEETDSVVSGMIYGAQWDAIMLWMKDVINENVEEELKFYITDSTNMGSYDGICSSCNGDGCDNCFGYGIIIEPIKTGSNSKYAVNNIFDLAGNCFEWTQEAYGTKMRVVRGGYYEGTGDVFPASYRDYYDPTLAYWFYTSRLQLYIKVD